MTYNLEQTVRELIARDFEEEWFEFKENWWEPTQLGEYISALSNTAAMLGMDHAYFIWGVNDTTHEIVGTSVNYYKNVNGEPVEHFLARNLEPDIAFSFHELKIDGKRIVVLEIPAAKQVPTAFNETRYYRIGSSKVKLSKYPEREIKLFEILRHDPPTLESVEADYQDLTFHKLFLYYEDKKLPLNKKTFKKNLGFLTKNGTYNLLAQLLSDNSRIPIRASIFNGTNKASQQYSVQEFGNNCLLYSLDKILAFEDAINTPRADERDRRATRKEVTLFDKAAFREAIINALVHNHWTEGDAPMITVYSDRIEILSRGKLAPGQTLQGFYLGESKPVNQRLSDIFLQLHISERSGRGVPKIVEAYGRDAFEFRENSIVVTLPFRSITEHTVPEEELRLTPTQQQIVDEMRNNPDITGAQLSELIGVSSSAVSNNIRFLKEHKVIERVGSNKTGWWKVL